MEVGDEKETCLKLTHLGHNYRLIWKSCWLNRSLFLFLSTVGIEYILLILLTILDLFFLLCINALWVGWLWYGCCLYPDPWQADNVFLVSFAAPCNASCHCVVGGLTLLVIFGSWAGWAFPFYSRPGKVKSLSLMQANFNSDKSAICPSTRGL